MAKLIINDKEFEIKDGSSISKLCESQGLVFNCNSGVCGSCKIKILSGHENLNQLSDEEIELGLDETNRLACMCTINNGIVKISF